jgi:tRNA G18 (ribose-2'-O)-methylase SpoU
LDSVSDPRLVPYRDLKRSNLTRWSGRFIAEGEKLVRRLLASRFALDSVLVAERFLDEFEPLVPPEVLLLVVPDGLVPEIVGFNFHRGVLACGRRLPRRTLDETVSNQGRLTLVICPDVQDPENLGGILRASAAFGADAVVLGERCGDPFSRRVLRVSMGTAFQVPIVESQDLAADLDRLRDQFGVELAATVLADDAERLSDTGRPQRLGLLFGSEGHGLDPEWVARCPRRITVPMAGGTDSLNVAMAVAVCLYHFAHVAS